MFSNSEFGFSSGAQFIGFEIEYPFTEELPGFRYPNIIGNAPTSEPVTVSGPAVSIPFSALFQVPRAERSSEAGLGKLSTRFHRAVPRMRFKQRSDGVHQTLRLTLDVTPR